MKPTRFVGALLLAVVSVTAGCETGEDPFATSSEERTDQPGAATQAPATQAPAAPTEAAPPPGTYQAGAYRFDDVQVSEDSLGDFAVRTRATNTGAEQDSVGIKATIFAAGSVVATAQGVHNSWAAGQTITLELSSTDDFREWDSIEFQVEYEF